MEKNTFDMDTKIGSIGHSNSIMMIQTIDWVAGQGTFPSTKDVVGLTSKEESLINTEIQTYFEYKKLS